MRYVCKCGSRRTMVDMIRSEGQLHCVNCGEVVSVVRDPKPKGGKRDAGRR